MAIFRVITFLIHAIVAAMASMLTAVFTHMLPAALVAVLALGGLLALCTTCGFSGLAFWKRRKMGE